MGLSYSGKCFLLHNETAPKASRGIPLRPFRIISLEFDNRRPSPDNERQCVQR